jgi:hypothetical protein
VTCSVVLADRPIAIERPGQRGGSSRVSEDPDEAGADVGPLVYQA